MFSAPDRAKATPEEPARCRGSVAPCVSTSAEQASIDQLAEKFPVFDADDAEGQAARAAVIAHIFCAWAQGTNKNYRYAWRKFVTWCNSKKPPLTYLPCSEQTLTLYLARTAESAKSFSVIKTISVAVRQAHAVLSLPSPTTGIHPSLIRTAAKRKIGVRVKNGKAPWRWAHMVDFTTNMCSYSASAPMWITS